MHKAFMIILVDTIPIKHLEDGRRQSRCGQSCKIFHHFSWIFKGSSVMEGDESRMRMISRQGMNEPGMAGLTLVLDQALNIRQKTIVYN